MQINSCANRQPITEITFMLSSNLLPFIINRVPALARCWRKSINWSL